MAHRVLNQAPKQRTDSTELHGHHPPMEPSVRVLKTMTYNANKENGVIEGINSFTISFPNIYTL